MNRKIYLLFIIMIIRMITLNAAVRTATVTGNWNAAATWQGGNIPISTDDVVINNNVNLTLDNNYTCNSVTIVAGANASALILSGFTLNVTSTITINAPTAGVNKRITVGTGVLNCASIFMTAGTAGNRDCLISISTGTVNVTGDITMPGAADRNYVLFSGAGFLNISGEFLGGAGGVTLIGTSTINYNGAGNQTIRNFTYDNLTLSSSGVKTLEATTTINRNLTIAGTAQLDPTVTPFNLSIAGNWNVTSSNADPFIERTSRVTFNGFANTQSINSPLPAGETFYNATFWNIFATSPQMSTTSHINISNDIDWTAGALDLAGKNLVITGGTATSAISNGTIFTTVPGSSITITDPTDTYTVDFNNFTVGTNTTTGAIPVTMTSNSSTWRGSKFYGATNFTKTGPAVDDFAGGNIFYGPSCYFKTTATAARWRMGNSNPTPDIFYNATFDANGTTVAGATNNNFIVGANSIGNEYFGTTTLISTTPGGFFIGRSNGTGNSSHIFHGPITVSVTATGNVTIGDAGASNTSTVTIENTLALNSSSTSIGDIYIGSATGYSSLTLTGAGQIIDGTILGATNIYFNSINQTNALPLSTISTATTNSTIFVGNLATSAATRCIFNGNVNFTSPNIALRGGTFNGTNNFTANGISTLSSYGGNIFNGASTFINNGSGDWNLGYNVADDFNANVVFNRNSSGILTPASRTNSAFSGNISTVGSNSVVTFCESSTTGTVTIDGNGTQTLSGSSSRIPIIRKLVMNTTAGGSLTLNVPLNISSSLLMTSGNIISNSTNRITLTDETVTSNIGNANSFINGPCYYDVTSNALNSLTFPVGKGTRWRPVILGERNSVATSITYKAEVFNTSARSLGYTMPATVDTVSDFNYWDVDRTLTSTGAALPTQSLTGTQSITLYYLDGDEVKDPANLRIVKNTSAAPTTWIDIGGTGSGAPAGFITSTSAPSAFTNYSRFTLGDAIGGGNPLPIELLSFTAMKNNKVIDVKWETATEINNDYYQVEKSKDGVNFESFNKVKGAGNSLSKLNYSIIDEKPYNGISYYRLKQVDFNGAFSYSKIESVDFNSSKDFSFDVYPNPNKGSKFNIAFEGTTNQEVLVVVYDVTGKESFSKVLITNENESSVFVIDPTNTLSSGVYIITATSNQEIYRKKLIVE
jgi:hypothetical protein